MVLQRVRVLVGVGDLDLGTNAAVADQGHPLGLVVVEADHLSAQQAQLELADVLLGCQQSQCAKHHVVGGSAGGRVVAVEPTAELRLQLGAGDDRRRGEGRCSELAQGAHLRFDLPEDLRRARRRR